LSGALLRDASRPRAAGAGAPVWANTARAAPQSAAKCRFDRDRGRCAAGSLRPSWRARSLGWRLPDWARRARARRSAPGGARRDDRFAVQQARRVCQTAAPATLASIDKASRCAPVALAPLPPTDRLLPIRLAPDRCPRACGKAEHRAACEWDAEPADGATAGDKLARTTARRAPALLIAKADPVRLVATGAPVPTGAMPRQRLIGTRLRIELPAKAAALAACTRALL